MNSPRGRIARLAHLTLVHPVLYLAGWMLMAPYTRISLRGARNIPLSGGCIVASNHRSYTDPIFLSALTPRPLRFLMHHSWYDRPASRWLYRLVGCIPVGDNHAAGRSLERAVDAIRAGAAVGIFPEGGVDWQGRMQPFHRGAAVLALWTGAPLVPAFIAGSHEVLPKGALIPRPRKVRVVAGAPIVVQPQNLHDIASEEISELTRRLQETIAALGRELLGDHPSTVVPAPANREVPPTVTPGTENPPGFRAEESS